MNQRTITATEILARVPHGKHEEIRATIAELMFFAPAGDPTHAGRVLACALVEPIIGGEHVVVSDHLRSVLGEAFGLREVEPPPWMMPGADVFLPWRGLRGIWSRIVRFDGPRVVMLPLLEGASEEIGYVGSVAKLQHREPVAA